MHTLKHQIHKASQTRASTGEVQYYTDNIITVWYCIYCCIDDSMHRHQDHHAQHHIHWSI